MAGWRVERCCVKKRIFPYVLLPTHSAGTITWPGLANDVVLHSIIGMCRGPRIVNHRDCIPILRGQLGTFVLQRQWASDVWEHRGVGSDADALNSYASNIRSIGDGRIDREI